MPEERCETCEFYLLQFFHKCMRIATPERPEMYQLLIAEVKCPFYKKGIWVPFKDRKA